VTLLCRGIASVLGACGFALLYNSSLRTVLVVGGLALVRQRAATGTCTIAAVQLASATFVGALAVGLLASLARVAPRRATNRAHRSRHHHHGARRLCLPGGRAVCQGNVIAGLQPAFLAAFVVGAMALGLATARFVSERKWLLDS